MIGNVLSRVNSVVIFANPDAMASHVKAVEKLGIESGISVLYLSCKHPDESIAAPIWVINRLLETISRRTRVGCVNPVAWFKYRKDNTEFRLLIQRAREQTTADALNSFLVHNNNAIKKQLRNLIEIEKVSLHLLYLATFKKYQENNSPR